MVTDNTKLDKQKQNICHENTKAGQTKQQQKTILFL